MLSAALQPGAQDGAVADSHWCGLVAIPEYLLAKVTGVTVGPCFPGWELLGSSASALAGPSEGHTSSPGLLVPLLPPLTPGTAAGKSQPVWLASPCGLCRRGQAAGQPLLLFLLGRLLEVTAQPQNDQLLFLCHMGHQKGIIALQTLVLLPLLGAPSVSHSPGLCGHSPGLCGQLRSQ